METVEEGGATKCSKILYISSPKTEALNVNSPLQTTPLDLVYCDARARQDESIVICGGMCQLKPPVMKACSTASGCQLLLSEKF
ncbi:hypothetical protein Hamer_G019840 [Homarus americanus]|uniref:Uncharacterized protein n=1 Tax=Homarus americanus TaxID=6706 RepID=A0A8J5JU25_HOMAM|nr:hypothetical protein Hamer_G019840 [Homarus americanus]